ncbi:hypothetical protein ACWDKQ_08340 [Saccharopolyspora sp. NPDC000995]
MQVTEAMRPQGLDVDGAFDICLAAVDSQWLADTYRPNRAPPLLLTADRRPRTQL